MPCNPHTARLVILLAAGLLGQAAVAGPNRPAPSQADFYVAPDGNDANPGTAERPFATLTAARDAVRKAIADGLDRDILILVRGGTYRVTGPLRFGPADSGTERHAITYAAAPGEEPVISGGRPIDGWEANDDGTWRVELPQVASGRWRFEQLFVNDHRRPRARHPNRGYLRVVRAGPDKRTSFTYQPDDVPDQAGGEGLHIVFLHDWSTSHIRVASIDRRSHTLHFADPIGPSARHYAIDWFEPHPRYFLTDDPALLDAPGEWHLDRHTGVLTYRPAPGETIESVEAIAPVAGFLLEVRGEPDRPVRNLHFVGLHFAHCGFLIPEHGYAGSQAGFHEQRDGGDDHIMRGMMPAALTFEHAEHCSFRDGSIRRLGGSGIRLGRQCRDCRLTGTVVSDTGGNGVMIGETQNRRVNGRPWWQAAPEQAASGNRVENCLIERVGQRFYGCVAIWAGLTEETIIAHNEIRRTPYTGVSIGWMWNPNPTPSGRNRVEHNHIHHVMQVLSDGGGIYTLGRQPGSVLRGNHIHDVPLNVGRAESNGMFLDEGTTELLIEHNVIHNVDRSPLRFHRAGRNLVRGNALVVETDTPPVRYNNTDPDDIRLEDNRIIPAAEWDPADAADLIHAAGPPSPSR